MRASGESPASHRAGSWHSHTSTGAARARAATSMLVALALAACSDDGGGAAAEEVGDLNALVASYDLASGDAERFVVEIGTNEQQLVSFGSARLRFSFLGGSTSRQPSGSTQPASMRPRSRGCRPYLFDRHMLGSGANPTSLSTSGWAVPGRDGCRRCGPGCSSRRPTVCRELAAHIASGSLDPVQARLRRARGWTTGGTARPLRIRDAIASGHGTWRQHRAPRSRRGWR